MKSNEIVRKIMKKTGNTHQSLAEMLGKSTGSYVSNKLYRANSMRVDSLVNLLNAMGYKVLITNSDETEKYEVN